MNYSHSVEWLLANSTGPSDAAYIVGSKSPKTLQALEYILSLNPYQVAQATVALLLVIGVSSLLLAKSTVPEGVEYPW